MLATTTAVSVLPGILWPSLEPVLLAGLTVAGSLSLSRCNRDRARDLPRCTETLASGN